MSAAFLFGAVIGIAVMEITALNWILLIFINTLSVLAFGILVASSNIGTFFHFKSINFLFNRFFNYVRLNFNNNMKGGPIFLIHVDADHNVFLLLKEILEGTNEVVDLKAIGGHQYEVLYHERDFIPGRLITENIDHCACICSRAIIILTPAFLKSNWCRYEFTIADSKNKVLFVKMLLNDKEEQELNDLLALPENSAIKTHLHAVTYLKWTGNEDDWQFWKRLVNILPQKKS